MKTEFTSLSLVASHLGLHSIFFSPQEVPLLESLGGNDADVRVLRQTVTQLEEYFSGVRRTFDIPLVIEGTDFQKQVWSELSKIPYGATVSYADIARRLRNEGAVRAVGAANGKNKMSIIIPCHRVIASNGSLAGYAGGLQMKSHLLRLEGHSQF